MTTETIIPGFRSPLTLGISTPFYLRALELFDHLQKTKSGYSIHSVGTFPKINFFTVDEFGDGNRFYCLQAAVAGYGTEDIDISLDHKTRQITIKNAKPKEPTAEQMAEADKREGFVMDTWISEIKRSSFLRTITLPDNANLDQVVCDYNNGILEIRMPVLKDQDDKITKVSINVKE